MRRPFATAAPAHLGVLTILFLVWHLLLAIDYVIVRFDLAQLDPSLDAVFTLAPGWAQVAWALGVWLGLIASLFMLFRDNAAVLVFFAAFVGMVVAVIGAERMAMPVDFLGLPRFAVYALLIAVPLIGWLYTRTMKRARVLL
jgi:hypothetical protein